MRKAHKYFMGGGSKSLIYSPLGCALVSKSYLLTSVGRDLSRPAGVLVYRKSIFNNRFMKKVFLFATAAIAALAMVSCNKEIDVPAVSDETCPEGYYVEELTAVYPSEPETRTAFNETTGKFAWTEGDELAFHLSNGEYTSAPIDPATSKVKLYLPVGVTRDNFAVYPASAVVDGAAEHGNMKVTLPDTYDISGNLQTDFVETPLIAINDADNKHLKFEHAGALLQFNLNVPAGVKTAKVSLGKTITGEFTLDEDATGNGAIEAGAVTDDDFVTFVLSNDANGLAEASAVKLLTPLPTGTYNSVKIAYDNGFEFSKELSTGWTFDRSGGKKVSISEDKFEDMTDYFWFEALEAGSTISMVNRAASDDISLEYSRDKKTWNSWDMSELTIENSEEKIWFRAKATKSAQFAYNHSSTSEIMAFRRFVGTGRLAVGGRIDSFYSRDAVSWSVRGLFYNMTTLVNAHELVMPKSFVFGNMTSVKNAKSAFSLLFAGCSSLETVPELPATELPNEVYAWMFSGCTSLTDEDLPTLPANKLSPGCYYGMFCFCSGLVDIPSDYLKATDFSAANANNSGITSNSTSSTFPDYDSKNYFGSNSDNSQYGAYQFMFGNCWNIKSGPNLPATELSKACYQEMFRGCTSLTDAPDLPADIVPAVAYFGMFNDCTALIETPTVSAKTKVNDNSMNEMFCRCSALKTVTFNLNAPIVGSRGYAYMFMECKSLVTGPQEITATTLGARACEWMFGYCAKLKSYPSFSEESEATVADNTFYNAFNGCTVMTGTVIVPFKKLGKYTCESMFQNCKNITSAIIRANDVDAMCSIRYMFKGCSKLNSIEVNFTAWPINYREDRGDTYQWVSGVAASGTFYKPSALPTEHGINKIPQNWEVCNLEEVNAGI